MCSTAWHNGLIFCFVFMQHICFLPCSISNNMYEFFLMKTQLSFKTGCFFSKLYWQKRFLWGKLERDPIRLILRHLYRSFTDVKKTPGLLNPYIAIKRISYAVLKFYSLTIVKEWKKGKVTHDVVAPKSYKTVCFKLWSIHSR